MDSGTLSAPGVLLQEDVITPKVFVSYRREDCPGHAGRLFDHLRTHFGAESVFMDVTDIEAGVDFVEAVQGAVGSCDVLLAVIGREWLSCADRHGRRRLEDPHDFIRLEIGTALSRGVRVIPVLVEGAAMPTTEDLPSDLQALTRRQAVELRDARWNADVDSLRGVLERVLTVKPVLPPPNRGVHKERLKILGAALIVTVVGLAVGVYLGFRERRAAPSRDTASFTEGIPKAPFDAEPPASANSRDLPSQNRASEPNSAPVPQPETAPTELPTAPITPTVPQRVRAVPKIPVAPSPSSERVPQRVLQVPKVPRSDPSAPSTETPSPSIPQPSIPNVIGHPIANAREILAGAGFEPRVKYSEERNSSGIVLDQTGPLRGSGNNVVDLSVSAIATVVILHDSTTEQTAGELASYVYGLVGRGRGYLLRTESRGRPVGEGLIQYNASDLSPLVGQLARGAGEWLTQRYGRRIELTPKLEPGLRSDIILLPVPGAAPAQVRRSETPEIVLILYSSPAELTVAEQLAANLSRSRGWRVQTQQSSVTVRSEGQIQYIDDQLSGAARILAQDAGEWLSRAYHRSVVLTPVQGGRAGSGTLALLLPSPASRGRVP